MRHSSRRQVLMGLAGTAAPLFGQMKDFLPAEGVNYADPATEFPVSRLTNPEFASVLPLHNGGGLARNGSFLVYASDRTGWWQAYRMDLRTLQSQLLTKASALDPASLILLPDNRGICYFDGSNLKRTMLASLQTRDVYAAARDWVPRPGLSVSGDGLHAAFAEADDKTSRIRLVTLATGAAATVVEGPDAVDNPEPRPRRAGILYRRGGAGVWLVNYDGRDNRPLKLALDKIGPTLWAPNGRTVLYLRFPDEPGQLNELREHTPDSNSDQLLSRTSQFVNFAVNSDASVFAGASGSKASPYVLLLLRLTQREMVLCEHKCSDPAKVALIFSPDSQRVYFTSDRHGKLAIYGMRVDRLVEKTQT